jgi:ankyrin repeat protein
MSVSIQKDFFDAIKNRDTKMVQLLLLNPNLNPAENDNKAFRYASETGNTDVVELLLAYKGNYIIYPEAKNNEAIREASKNGHTEVVKLLLEYDGKYYKTDPYLTVSDNKLIRSASKRGLSQNEARKVLDCHSERHGNGGYYAIDPGAKDNEAINEASKNGHTEVVELLLKDRRVNPNEAIREASKNGHIKVVKLLLKDRRVNPTVKDNESLREANKNGHTRVVQLLLKDDRVLSKFDDKIIKLLGLSKLADDCSICLQPLSSGDIQKTNCCKHFFHKECIKTVTKCPMCRNVNYKFKSLTNKSKTKKSKTKKSKTKKSKTKKSKTIFKTC